MKEDLYIHDTVWFLGKYLIIKSINGKLLCKGNVVNTKSFTLNDKTYVFPSIDNHLFFNLYSKKFIVSINDHCESEIFIAKGLKKDYITKRITTINTKKPNLFMDIVLDNDVFHLDKHVDKLVYALNSVGIDTDSSCSGHYNKPLFVSCSFINLEQVIKIRKLLADHFNEDFYLCSLKNSRYVNDTNLNLSIVSYHKGKSAYRAAARLATYLKSYFY